MLHENAKQNLLNFKNKKNTMTCINFYSYEKNLYIDDERFSEITLFKVIKFVFLNRK